MMDYPYRIVETRRKKKITARLNILRWERSFWVDLWRSFSINLLPKGIADVNQEAQMTIVCCTFMMYSQQRSGLRRCIGVLEL
jgi:hypothetical protein